MLVPLLALTAGAAGARFLARVSAPPRPHPGIADQLNWSRLPFPGVVLQ